MGCSAMRELLKFARFAGARRPLMRPTHCSMLAMKMIRFRFGLFAKSSGLVLQLVRSMPASKNLGFTLLSVAGWLLTSNEKRIEASVRFALSPLLSLASVGAVEDRSQGLGPQPPNPSFNGTPCGAR